MRRVLKVSKRPLPATAVVASRRGLFIYHGVGFDITTRKQPHTACIMMRLHTAIINSSSTTGTCYGQSARGNSCTSFRIQRASFCTPTAAHSSGVAPSVEVSAIPAAVRVQAAAERLNALLTSSSSCADRSEVSTSNGLSEEITEAWTELGNAIRIAASSSTSPSLTTAKVGLDTSNQLYTVLSSADPRVSVCGKSVSCIECYKEAIRGGAGATDAHVGVVNSAVVYKAWEGLGALLAEVDEGRVASGAMPLFVNVGGKNLTALDCLAKSIETYAACNQKKGDENNDTSGSGGGGNGPHSFQLYFGAPLSLWQRLAWGLHSRQTEIDTVAGGAAEGYDVKKRAATVTIRGEVFDAEAALVVVAILSQPSLSASLYAETWTQLATLITKRGKAALRDYAHRLRGYEEAVMAQREGKMPSSLSSLKLTPPQVPEPPSVRVPVDSALPRSAYAFLTPSSCEDLPSPSSCSALLRPIPPTAGSASHSITLSVTDVLARLIEALLEVHVGGDAEATSVRGSSIDSLYLLSSAWLQLGDALAGNQNRSSVSKESDKGHTAIVGKRSYTSFECYIKAAEAADTFVCAASSTATSLNTQTLDSLSYVWHVLGANIRARSSSTLHGGAATGEEEITLTVAVVDLEEVKGGEQTTTSGTLRRSAVAFTALKAFARAAEIAPRNPSHWLNLALTLPGPSPHAFTYADVPDVEVGGKPYELSDTQGATNTPTAARGAALTAVAGVGYTKAQLLIKVIELGFESCPAQQSLPANEEVSRAFGLLGACLLAEDSAKASRLNEKVQKVVQEIFSKADKTLTRDMLPTAIPAILPSVATVAVPAGHTSINTSSASKRDQSTNSTNTKRTFTARECLLASIESFMLSGEGLPFTGETGRTWLLLGELLLAESQTQRSAEGGRGQSVPSLLFIKGISESEGPLCASQCFANAVSCLPNSPESWLRCGSSLLEEASFECNASDTKEQNQQTIYARRAIEVSGHQYTIVDCLSKALELSVERSAVAVGAELLPAGDSVYYQMLGTAMKRVGVKSAELRLGRSALSSYSSEDLLLRAAGR